MEYKFKDLIIKSNFDIFNVKFIQFYADFFELYYENNNKFYQFYVYLSEQDEILFKAITDTYYRRIGDLKSKLNFFEFIEYISTTNYNKTIFNRIKDKLSNDYVEFLV